MNDSAFNILLIEDNPGDARLIHEMLTDADLDMPDAPDGFDLEWEERLADGLDRLMRDQFDVILLDLSLPDSHGLETFKSVQAKASQIPVIVLSGLADSNTAVSAVRMGAQDYLVKGQVDSNLLSRAIRYALERKKAEIERNRLIAELKAALSEINTLSGLLPICASCKKIRDDKGYWNQLESYISTHSEAEFSHSYCPECAVKLFPEFIDEDDTLFEKNKEK